HIQVVCNGQVVRELRLPAGSDSLEVHGSVPVAGSGWCLLRAFTQDARYPVLDNFVYATTSPVYLNFKELPPRNAADARLLKAWIEQLIRTTDRYPDWNTAAEKRAVLDELEAARAVYERLERQAAAQPGASRP